MLREFTVSELRDLREVHATMLADIDDELRAKAAEAIGEEHTQPGNDERDVVRPAVQDALTASLAFGQVL